MYMYNKAKQRSTPKAVTFPRKNELPRVGLEPTTLTCIYMYIQRVFKLVPLERLLFYSKYFSSFSLFVCACLCVCV